jgi:hypothetical protein
MLRECRNSIQMIFEKNTKINLTSLQRKQNVHIDFVFDEPNNKFCWKWTIMFYRQYKIKTQYLGLRFCG